MEHRKQKDAQATLRKAMAKAVPEDKAQATKLLLIGGLALGAVVLILLAALLIESEGGRAVHDPSALVNTISLTDAVAVG